MPRVVTDLGPCGCCPGGACCPKTPNWVFTVGTTTGDDCTGLSDTEFTAEWLDDPTLTSRRWFTDYTGPNVECIGFGQGGLVGAYLTCRPADQPDKYTLTFETSDSIGLANYEILAGDWNCSDCNVMTKVSDQTCCTMPATITVCPQLMMMARSTQGIVPAATKATPAAPCSHLGRELTGAERGQHGKAGSVKLWKFCLNPDQPLGPVVCACEGCGLKCSGYRTTTAPIESTGVGVIVGCYGMAGLAELQVAAIRATCGNVPILLADDASPDVVGMRRAGSRPGVTWWPSAERDGHYAGDLAAFWKGLQWAVNLNLKYVCKLSQRFIWTEQNWLRRAVSRLEASGQATLMQACMDNGVNLYARTECMLFDVAKWSPHLSAFGPRGDLNNPTELAVWHNVHALFGGNYLTWDELPVNRYQPAPGTLWHGSNAEADYRRYAATMGVDLGADFHAAASEAQPTWKRG